MSLHPSPPPSKDQPRALDGVTFHVPGGSKVGIVGRTGSGKSSLCNALFRLVLEDVGPGGRAGGEDGQAAIMIDGRDIKTVGVDTLRNGMSLVAQVFVLFIYIFVSFFIIVETVVVCRLIDSSHLPKPTTLPIPPTKKKPSDPPKKPKGPKALFGNPALQPRRLRAEHGRSDLGGAGAL